MPRLIYYGSRSVRCGCPQPTAATTISTPRSSLPRRHSRSGTSLLRSSLPPTPLPTPPRAQPQKLCRPSRRDPPPPELLIHPSSRGSRGRRSSTEHSRPEKVESRRCEPGRRIGSPPLRRERRRRLCIHLAPHRCMCAEVGKGEHHPPPPSAAARLPLPPRRVRSRRRSSRAMADKENSAYAAAAAPRITRASAKRAAAVTAVAVAAKRKRVALSEIPTLPNAAPQPHTKPKKSSSQVAKPKKKSLSSLSLPAPPKPAAGAADETGDPQLCAPYASDIYSYLRSMEVQAKRRPAADYIERVQMDVTPNMRGILVDWLVEVAEEYKLVSDTLYLTVSYIDRFLSSNTLNRQKLQRQHARFAKSSEMGAASSHAFQVGVSRSTPAAMCTARSRSSSANREPLRTGGTLRLHPSPPLTGPCL